MAKYSNRRLQAERENMSKPHITREGFGHWNYIWLNGFCCQCANFCQKLNDAAQKRGLKD